MSSTPEEIAAQWREQMQKGYLKLAILYVLTRGPLHGYEMMKRINEWTLGVITPTAGGMYPTLKELENKELIKGEWIPEERKKVYRITEKGRTVFREAVRKHFKLASSIRRWFFKELSSLGFLNETDLPAVMEPAVRVLLLKEDASTEEKIQALQKLRERLQHFTLLLCKMVDEINLKEKELKAASKTTKINDESSNNSATVTE